MSWKFFVVIGIVILLLLFRRIKTIRQLIVEVALVVVVIGVIAKFCPTRYSLLNVIPPSVVERIAGFATNANDVKVVQDRDGNTTIYFLLEGKWHDIRDFKTLMKSVKKYQLVSEDASYSLSKEQMKIIKELFIP